MQSVRPAHRLTAALVACALLAALVVATVAFRSPAPRRHVATHPGVALIGGVSLQRASCAQWLGATAGERAGILRALQRTVGGPTAYGPATALSAADGARLFDRACARPYARGFLLYELYTRASAFSSVPQT